MFTFLVIPDDNMALYTGLFYCLKHTPDMERAFDGILKSNVEILENAIQAVEDLCPNLQFWTFQTGGKVKQSYIPSLELYN